MKVLIFLVVAYSFINMMDAEPLPEPQKDAYTLCMEAYQDSDNLYLCELGY